MNCFKEQYVKARGKKRGFTLLETMVALAIMLAAAVGPVALITRGIFSFSFAKNRLIANNLAQEGLELVRAARDNNILCDSLNGSTVYGWTSGLTSSIEADALPGSVTTISCGSETIATRAFTPFAAQFLKYDDNPASPSFGLYNYTTGGNTIFKRFISAVSPPSIASSGMEPDSDIPSSNQMDVIVRVEWQERGIGNNFIQCPTTGSRCLTLRERLYNWR